LTTELNSANQILQGIPEQMQEVNEMYSAITGYGTSQNG
jgi:flagellar hook-associated protein 2